VAVVKANYTRAKPRVKASARYYSHRPAERERGRAWRDAYDGGGDMTKREVYERLDRWGEGYYYRLVLNPGAGREHRAETMEDWVRRTMEQLEERGMVRDWVAWTHDDHSAHAHAHVLAWSNRRWTREDLAEAREAATREWERVRELERERERDDYRWERGRA